MLTFVDIRHQNEHAQCPPPPLRLCHRLRLHCFSIKRRSALGVSVTESFDSFLVRLSSQAASTDAIARGVAIETYRGAQGDGPGITSDKHILSMGLKHPSRFEIRDGANHRMSYVRQPGSLSLVPAGVRPMMRAETEFDLVACALDSGL